MTVAPIALVAALRETSVLFAALLGTVLLREPVLPARIVAAVPGAGRRRAGAAAVSAPQIAIGRRGCLLAR